MPASLGSFAGSGPVNGFRGVIVRLFERRLKTTHIEWLITWLGGVSGDYTWTVCPSMGGKVTRLIS
jgi:hypothetical protein